jgi:drug/metabolite transporter (DMT)-like permease
MRSPQLGGAAIGLGAALLFGLSAPVAKLLLPGSGPFMLAGLLYLGSGLGLLGLGPLLPRHREAPLRRGDAAPLLGVVLAGGVVGPVLLMLGLGRLPGSSASLLLNLEAPFTIALAVFAFGESLERIEIAGAAAVVAGAAALGLQGPMGEVHTLGALCVAGACFAWAIDNNLSQRLSLHDPVAITRVKSLAAGSANVLLAVALGEHLAGGRALLGALVTGFLGYGVSIVLHLLAMREVGAARQAAFFATAPFAGALASVPLLSERLTPREIGAAAVMALGVVLMLRARHAHGHVHEALEHEHAHAHDEHHLHVHEGGVSETHSHPHVHAALAHDHPHLPDAHHRHRH